MTLLKKKKANINAKSNFMTPTQTRIFNMDHDVLLRHYVLILLKVSRLRAEQRRLVLQRTKYLVENKTISQEQLEIAINEIEEFTKIQE